MKTLAAAIREYLEQNKEAMISYLKELVIAESPSRVPQAQAPVMQLLRRKMESNCCRVFYMPGKNTGGYLVGRPGQRQKNQPLQLLLGHCDTVWAEGTLDTMPLIEKEGRLQGPGVYDMKAGLAQILFALEAIGKTGNTPEVTPVVLINSDEEIGSRESTLAIKRLARIADRAFVLEPPLGLDGKLKTARKGLGRFTITIEGKPAHAGLDPGKGASAIVELSHQIQRLFSLNDPEKGITVNVGMIEGGVSPNVVAPVSKAVVDVRVLTAEDGRYISEKIRNLQPVDPNTRLAIEGGMGRPPMEPTPRNQQLWRLAKNIGAGLGIPLEQATAGGGSDGNTTSLYTATLDGLGTVGDGAHAHHEFIFTDKLVERTLLLALLIMAPPLNHRI